MRVVIASIEAEYQRYKNLAERALRQLSDAQLADGGAGTDNSVATVVRHVGGNLRSRFTDFLTTDGEKPWRNRDGEFAPSALDRSSLLACWEEGWRVLAGTLAGLSDDDLTRTVAIRSRPLTVIEALHRSLAHTASHVGQIVFRAKQLLGDRWECLSIPRGKSEEYNKTQQHAAPRP